MKGLKLARPLAAGVLLAGLLGSGLPAQANHHGPTEATCRVSGGVKIYKDANLEDGQVRINALPAKHYFVFTDDTALTCSGVIMGTQIVNKAFQVTAQGWTTGITNPNGEICEEGKSDGEADLVATGTRILYGGIQFRRIASAVYAWGSLYSDAGRSDRVATLDATMAYTPKPAPDAVGCLSTDPNQGVQEADLDGIGVVTDHAAPTSRPIP